MELSRSFNFITQLKNLFNIIMLFSKQANNQFVYSVTGGSDLIT